MKQRASESLVAVLIRIGLLLALAILLMAENAQAETLQARLTQSGVSRTVHLTYLQLHDQAAGIRFDQRA